MFHPNAKFHCGLFVVGNKIKTKFRFHAAATLAFYILQKYPEEAAYSSIIYLLPYINSGPY
jgi:hypothetical protein